MRVQIISTVPSDRQRLRLESLIGGKWYQQNPDGSLTFTFDFMTKREAAQWLRERAHCLAFDSVELREMLTEIAKRDQLTVDAITARIYRDSSPKKAPKTAQI